MRKSSELYWEKKRFECGLITLNKFEGPLCSIIINNCRVEYHGYIDRLKGLEIAIRKAYRKSCDTIVKEYNSSLIQSVKETK